MKSGFVSILGRPNAGKSTLLNTLVGSKIAIVAAKPQTTRQTIQGVVTRPDAQIVFLDSPGIHQPRDRLNQRMMREVRAALEARDLLLLMADATVPFGSGDERAVELIRSARTPAVLALNKVDRLAKKEELLLLIDKYRGLFAFEEYFPISALTGEGVGELTEALVARLPEGPQYFPPDHITDQPVRHLAGELIREKIIRETRQEIPYSAAVVVEQFEESPRLIRLAATIYVERDGQKGIIIGPKGERLKQVGTLARQEMEGLLGRKVFLDLHVKVRRDWRDSETFLAALDWRKRMETHAEDDSWPRINANERE
ncbi:MAG: GTPase Era [Acidobacteria bacterium]|nr:GTPase Era [Acidobacteriota bacterium]